MIQSAQLFGHYLCHSFHSLIVDRYSMSDTSNLGEMIWRLASILTFRNQGCILTSMDWENPIGEGLGRDSKAFRLLVLQIGRGIVDFGPKLYWIEQRIDFQPIACPVSRHVTCASWAGAFPMPCCVVRGEDSVRLLVLPRDQRVAGREGSLSY